jgi:CPA2 family monovalent cation:H+ antiporter-2
MAPDAYNLKIVLILTIGFSLASILGYISQRIRLSPILGYLLAGYAIGPFSPGFVADLVISEQLAEIGVILMMFGVGLHFKWKDLISVRQIAIPGAIGQTLAAAVSASVLIHFIGWSWEAGVIIGLSVGVASTVVLVRVLSDQQLLDTRQGHIAIGWLIVEDILTVIVLILLPTIVALLKGTYVSAQEIAFTLALTALKLLVLAAVMFTIGRKVVAYILFKVAHTRSSELFTLTILALTFLIATSSSLLFGASIALGAFIAGMVIGQTDVRHQASAHASTMKDAFIVIFFLSVGMLFNPSAIVENFPLFASVLAVILVFKPLAAFLIVLFLRQSFATALTIAIALAQIGEFSFILAEEAIKFDVLPDEGFDIIVACALISISINPILFKVLDYLKRYAKRGEALVERHENIKASSGAPKAVVVGFGLIGKQVVGTLEKVGFTPLIIDHNVDTVANLMVENREVVYGDASMPAMLTISQLESARLLVVTTPDVKVTLKIIQAARAIHPKIAIMARVRYVEDQGLLGELGVNVICCDEEEVGKAFAHALSRSAKLFFHHIVEGKSVGLRDLSHLRPNR